MLRRRCSPRGLIPAIVVLLALGCASANRLSRQSEEELTSGDLAGAYRLARRAVEKEPGHPRARAAFAAAAAALITDRSSRVRIIAEVDSVAAAERLLELATLRGEAARHGYATPPDTAFARAERSILEAAAAHRYRAAERALSSGRPKVAWAEFRDARRYLPGFRDLDRRIDEAHALALARVAILPLADQTGVPGLSRAITDRIRAEVARHVRPDQFVFTRLVDPARIDAGITLAEADDLTRADAIRIGRRLGADQVVTGRIYGLRSSTNTTAVHQPIYRRQVDRDTAGVRRERYVEQDLHAVERERTVTVRYELEIVDTREGASLSRFDDEVEGHARVVFTDFRPTGSLDDYVIVPPGLSRSDRDRAERLEADWRRHFGTWTLPALLRKARDDRRRSHYTAADRPAFFGDGRERPVWLGGLPGEEEMAAIALDVIWQPVLGMLQELDAK